MNVMKNYDRELIRVFFFSQSLFCCVKPAVERDLSPPSIDVEVQVKMTFRWENLNVDLYCKGCKQGEDRCSI